MPSNLQHLVDGVSQGLADAVLAASIFHFGEYSVPEAKAYMADQGIEALKSLPDFKKSWEDNAEKIQQQAGHSKKSSAFIKST